ncbi:phosphoribosyl-AMP cyclohydrolase [Hahella sp. KA22]|uniref:phosphoribosyl-AMP cyclohydrolase n=1 Tax=unclassified Hahella TaxID=2624107 RepID=UPI000FDD23EF|nr:MULTISPECIES: phosphoribosyl-AMP cyclohydrolase [unclassified Hahella]AZZ94329.1 phosphoribosyl-AMP cyclohydrolase [Hahella sp. KA22]MBU6953156.1 phosphoribosyl-AMP cyclohydrolase [Hahella sp. HN01]MDG9669854.1 phosphoribosyl-AMP cyclohydrolase [Hahella sp. CR1]QAY57703.1 phosphoribosyl-AMP cyclohydrolase [Hahella sp. KA22]
MTEQNWRLAIKWNNDGLIPVIAQDNDTGTVLMMAWMNEDALSATIAKQEAVYWSRSREKLWHKGETSGHVQKVKDILLDCDGDTLLLKVEQIGGIACHTGRENCFFRSLDAQEWKVNAPVKKDPKDIYG